MILRILIAGLAMFVVTPQIMAQSDTTAENSASMIDPYRGDWAGELPGTGLTIIVHISGDTADTAAINLDSPKQSAFGLPGEVTGVSAEQITAKFTSLGASLELARTGDTLKGQFTQGTAFDIELSPVDPNAALPTAEEYVRPQSDNLTRNYKIETVAFPGGADDVQLAGELTLPHDTSPKALLILISGSGPQDRNEELVGHKPFLVLSDHLTRQGFGVLRYDDRGVADSTGDFDASTTLDFANDAAAAINYLRSRLDLPGIPVGLIGHSEGGFIAPLAAETTRPDMMVLLAGPSQTLAEVVIQQGQDILAADGVAQEIVAANGTQSRKQFEILRQTPAADRETALIDFLIGNGATREQAELGAQQLTSPWMLWGFDYDPIPALTSYTGPVLAVFGEKDLQVAPATNAPAMRAALGTPASKVVVLDGLNHLFQPAETGHPSEYAAIETTFDEGAMALIADWLSDLPEP